MTEQSQNDSHSYQADLVAWNEKSGIHMKMRITKICNQDITKTAKSIVCTRKNNNAIKEEFLPSFHDYHQP